MKGEDNEQREGWVGCSYNLIPFTYIVLVNKIMFKLDNEHWPI